MGAVSSKRYEVGTEGKFRFFQARGEASRLRMVTGTLELMGGTKMPQKQGGREALGL